MAHSAAVESGICELDDKSLTCKEIAEARYVEEDFQSVCGFDRLWDVPDDSGTKCFRDPQRQALPDRDSRGELCVCWSVVRHRGLREKQIFPVKRCLRGAPLQLELMRARTARRASEIERADPQLGRVLEHGPIQQHVRTVLAVLTQR